MTAITRSIRAALATLALVTVSRPASAQMPEPAQSPSPAPSASPAFTITGHGDCPYDVAPPAGVVAAFARPIDDERTVAFITMVERMPPALWPAVGARARSRHATADSEIYSGIRSNCAEPELVARTARVTTAIQGRWSVDRAGSLEPALRAAIGALLLQQRSAMPHFFGNDVSSAARDATLAVFGTSEEEIDAMLATQSLSSTPNPNFANLDECNVPAKAVKPFIPAYPESARRSGAAGTFIVDVDLDAHGFVRSAVLASTTSTATGRPFDDLVRESTRVAGISDFAPAFSSCKPLGAVYSYRTEYSSE